MFALLADVIYFLGVRVIVRDILCFNKHVRHGSECFNPNPCEKLIFFFRVIQTGGICWLIVADCCLSLLVLL